MRDRGSSLTAAANHRNDERREAMYRNRERHGIGAGPGPTPRPTSDPREPRSTVPPIPLENPNDPFVILGLSRMRLTLEALKTAYRRAAKRAHPDHGGSDLAFRRVETAYRVILKKYFPNEYEKSGQP